MYSQLSGLHQCTFSSAWVWQYLQISSKFIKYLITRRTDHGSLWCRKFKKTSAASSRKWVGNKHRDVAQSTSTVQPSNWTVLNIPACGILQTAKVSMRHWYHMFLGRHGATWLLHVPNRSTRHILPGCWFDPLNPACFHGGCLWEDPMGGSFQIISPWKWGCPRFQLPRLLASLKIWWSSHRYLENRWLTDAQGFTIPDIKKKKGIMFLLTKFLFNAGYIPVSAPEEFGHPNTMMLFPVAVTQALDSFGM